MEARTHRFCTVCCTVHIYIQVTTYICKEELSPRPDELHLPMGQLIAGMKSWKRRQQSEPGILCSWRDNNTISSVSVLFLIGLIKPHVQFSEELSNMSLNSRRHVMNYEIYLELWNPLEKIQGGGFYLKGLSGEMYGGSNYIYINQLVSLWPVIASQWFCWIFNSDPLRHKIYFCQLIKRWR
jgi:hypothetical protein